MLRGRCLSRGQKGRGASGPPPRGAAPSPAAGSGRDEGAAPVLGASGAGADGDRGGRLGQQGRRGREDTREVRFGYQNIRDWLREDSENRM